MVFSVSIYKGNTLCLTKTHKYTTLLFENSEIKRVDSKPVAAEKDLFNVG